MIDGVYSIMDRIEQIKKRFGLMSRANRSTELTQTENSNFNEELTQKTQAAVNSQRISSVIAQDPGASKIAGDSDVTSAINTIMADKTSSPVFASLSELNKTIMQKAAETYKKSETSQVTLQQFDEKK